MTVVCSMASFGSSVQVRHGATCQKSMLRTTCYNRFVRWRRAGVWDQIMNALAAGARSHSPDGRKRTIALARHVRSEPCTFAVEHHLQPCRLGCPGAIQPEILHSV